MRRTATLSPAFLLACCLAGSAPARDAPFRRGDSNADGEVGLSDAVFTLGFLFLGSDTPSCRDAADANDDGALDLTDGVAILETLFLGAPPPPPPYETCGGDPTNDGLDCVSFAPCANEEGPQVEISEFLADNTRTLRDGDGELSDWIELTNRGAVEADISGYHLTDDPGELRRWTFPQGTVLGPGESLVVFASGRDPRDPRDRDGWLHTSFRLDSDGEPIALVHPDGVTVVSSFGPDVPAQLPDVSYGLSSESVVPRFLVEEDRKARYVVGSRAVDPDWAGLDFDANEWSEGRAALGYETEPHGLFRGKFRTDLSESMPGVASSLFVRIPFRVDDPAAVESLTLSVRYDDGFVAGLNGVEVARENAPPEITHRSRSKGPRKDRAAVGDFVSIDIPSPADALEPGRNVLTVLGLNDDPESTRFLLVPVLEARVRGRLPVHFTDPTPGEPNGRGIAGTVRDTEFSADRGFYDGGFEVAITTATPGAEIRYTLDGSAPTATRGEVYTGPLPVETTTTLRAAAFREDLLPTNVDTQTYVFLEDVIRQPFRVPGFPATWAGNPADYGMDPDIVDHPAYRDSIEEDLRAIPTLSIVTDRADLFGSRGLYQNPEGRGLTWERAVSMELFSAGGRENVQEEAGLRIHGGAGRRPEHPKKSFRLIFRKRYGAGKLRYPLFTGEPYGEGAAEEFDKLVLRGGFNNTLPHWYDEQVRRSQYIRDQWSRDIQLEMGHPSPRGLYVHLYLNGLYWGLYNVTERPDEDWGASYLGGEEEDFDVIKNGGAAAGSMAGWNRLQSLASGGVTGAEYEAVGGLADFVNLADHMLENIWYGNTDWDHNNSVAVRRRATGGPFVFPNWDTEFGICLPPGSQPDRWDPILTIDKTRVNSDDAPSAVFQSLRQHEEFALLLADRIHRHFFHGGVLTPERATELWMRRADALHGPIVGETARWGDYRRDVFSRREPRSNFPLFTRDEHWLEHQRWIIEEYFPQRAEVILGQFRAAGYWPDAAPPAFSRYGGEVEPGFGLEIRTTAGTLYFTTDGSDPRLPGGDVSPLAVEGSGAASTTLRAERSPVRVLVPAAGSPGGDWRAPGFDDADWREGTGGVGYDRGDRYLEHIGTDVGAAMDGVNSSVYIRATFELAAIEDFDLLTFAVKYDDGFVAYLNGERVASRNAPAKLRWDSQATRTHPDGDAVLFEGIDITEHRDLLLQGTNVLAVHGLNVNPTSSDFLIGCELRTGTVARSAVRIEESMRVKARILEGSTWTPLTEALFEVDRGIRVTELMFHPPPPVSEERELGFDDADDFEFLELENTGPQPAELDGWWLTAGVRLRLPALPLAPGEHALFVRDRDAFAARYGPGLPVLGEYEGRLSNAGETVALAGPFGVDAVRFTYDDDWYPETDGEGHSLVLTSPGADPERRDGWKPSRDPLGTPGQ